jgi:hypothetical protein
MRRQQLQESLGILTSEDWWAECVANINNGRAAAAPADVEEEAILEQLWHHDLRDVVDINHPSEAATALRRAVAQSQQQQPPTVRLPENFRLLVQVENVSNMAVNAEKRLAPDGAAQQHFSSSPSSSRCLKLAFSDGYNDGHSGPEAAAPTCFTAMEVSTIPELTTNARAGVKVLIRGPMTIRHGICGWTAANAIVLGGQVEELLQYQQQALQRERQRVGHGVDPTVKALIWMTNNGGDPQDDETNNNEQGTFSYAEDRVDGSHICFCSPLLVMRLFISQSSVLLKQTKVSGLVATSMLVRQGLLNRRQCIPPSTISSRHLLQLILWQQLREPPDRLPRTPTTPTRCHRRITSWSYLPMSQCEALTYHQEAQIQYHGPRRRCHRRINIINSNKVHRILHHFQERCIIKNFPSPRVFHQ